VTRRDLTENMSQIRRVTLAALCIALIMISLLVGIQLSNYQGHARTTTVNQTILQTTTIGFGSTLTKTVTYYGTYYGPSSVLVSGQINSVNYSVQQLLFENSGNVYSANLTYYGGSSSNASDYWNGSAYVPTGFSAYWATGFSATLPNNLNYSVTAIFNSGLNVSIGYPDDYLALFNNTNGTGHMFIQCSLSNQVVKCQ
jgi:hypothetical protein